MAAETDATVAPTLTVHTRWALDVLAEIEAWAKENNLSRNAAMQYLMAVGLREAKRFSDHGVAGGR